MYLFVLHETVCRTIINITHIYTWLGKGIFYGSLKRFKIFENSWSDFQSILFGPKRNAVCDRVDHIKIIEWACSTPGKILLE
jgi:hypothetical protein